MTQPPGTQLGRVYLVGAGPGDPGLMTLRGVACLRRADLVLYDYLVDPAILVYVPPSAEAICLGHHTAERTMPPRDEMNLRHAAFNSPPAVTVVK